MKKVSFQGSISDKCRSVRLALNVKNVVKMLPSNLWRALVSHAWTAYINYLLVDEQMLYYSNDSQRDLISNNYPFPTPPCRPVGKAWTIQCSSKGTTLITKACSILFCTNAIKTMGEGTVKLTPSALWRQKVAESLWLKYLASRLRAGLPVMH